MVTNAAKTALAYMHITGEFPRGIQLATWSQINDLADRDGNMRRALKPEALALIDSHPFKVAHDYLTGLGFRVIPHQRGTSHYVSYINHDNGDGATAYRAGGATVRPYSDKPPYRSENLSHDQIVTAMEGAAS
jgi:hypothetical protein